MGFRVLDSMDTAWTSLSPALDVAADAGLTAAPGGSSNRLTATSAAVNADAERVLPAPVDLRGFDELRLWVRADRPADGSRERPFFLELSYVDDGDTPADDHRWFVPINQPRKWSQCRIGVEGERRAAVRRLRLRALGGPFRCYVDELIAAFDAPLTDVETALTGAVSGPLDRGPQPALAVAAAANAIQVIVTPMTTQFAIGNRVRVTGGTAGPELHDVVGVTQQANQNRTVLAFANTDRLIGSVPSGTGRVAIFVPLLVESPPLATPAISPAIFATHLGAREDPQRSPAQTQRDTFRRRGAHTVCSVRPGARAMAFDYQLTAVGQDRAQQRTAYEQILRALSLEKPLWVNGSPSPVQTILDVAPELERARGVLSPFFVGVGTRVETASRQEATFAERTHVGAGPLEGPKGAPVVGDEEGIVITL